MLPCVSALGSELLLSLGSWEAADRQEDVGERILGRLHVLLPLLETSLVRIWDYEKAECQNRPEAFLHKECESSTLCPSFAFFAAGEVPGSEVGLGVGSGICHDLPSS